MHNTIHVRSKFVQTQWHWNTLQHAATHCVNSCQNTHMDDTTLVRSEFMQTQRHCNTLQHTATHCNTLQHLRRSASVMRNAGRSLPCSLSVIAHSADVDTSIPATNHAYESRTLFMRYERCTWTTNYVETSRTMYMNHELCVWITNYVCKSRIM